MNNLKILACLLLFQFLFVISPLIVMGEEVASKNPETQSQEKSKIEQAKEWNQKGIDFYKKKEYTKAIECFQKAVELKPNEIDYTINLSNAYRKNGKFDESEKLINEALEKFPNEEVQKNLRIELAEVHFLWAKSLEKKYDHVNAIRHYENAYAIDKVFRPKNAALDLITIGFFYSGVEENQKALEFYEKALPIWREVGYKAGEAVTLTNIGYIYAKIDEKQKALEYFEDALIILQTVGNLAGQAKTFHNLMFFWEDLRKTQLSIFYGKQSINQYQKIRANITDLKKELQRNFLESKKDIYRKLANILIIEGRLSEAQQVLDMLKEEEFFEFIRRDHSFANILSSQVDYTPFEKRWLEKYNTIMENLSTISSKHHVLKFKQNKNEDETKRMEELGAELFKGQKIFEDFLNRLKDAFDKHEKEIKEGKIDHDTLAKEASALQKMLKYLDENEVGKHIALHYLVYGGRVSVIFTTPLYQSVKQTDINEKEFNQMVMNYRDYVLKSGKGTPDGQLVDSSTETKNKINPYEKKLYDIIFKPVDEELKKYGVTNLMISLDGVLRYIPIAALWDGENYLVQRYRITILTPSSLKNIKDEPVTERKILGLGASRGGHGFKRLPYVRKEIQAIVNDKEKGYNGLIQGKAFLDSDFTKSTMLKALEKKDYPLVHISSHFKFSPGDETKNFLLLGDGNILKLSEIRRIEELFENVNLLVLSACQTGVGGNGEEIDGFGELAQQSGAKSVVASLWPVSDESTRDLMVSFYQIMKERRVTSKIEALRQAQLELAGLEDLLEKDKQKAKKKTKYSHPYYWGAFIMMGNWR